MAISILWTGLRDTARASALFKHEPLRRLREGARTAQSLDLDHLVIVPGFCQQIRLDFC
ncbi:hypothetical protein RQ479_11030 [Mesorhizobium sp. ISC25]|uniref:hypothetical protein n=1 Tax=Mesorhizobium sp. ISC25 TaxID=3077335 RepID=UPI0035DC88B1